MVAYPAVADGASAPGFQSEPLRFDLQVVRASALAQARLQLAVLSGNRRRVLGRIGRLLAMDKQVDVLARGNAGADLESAYGDRTDHRWAIASEKLVGTSKISLPRLEPAFGAGVTSAVVAEEEEVEIV